MWGPASEPRNGGRHLYINTTLGFLQPTELWVGISAGIHAGNSAMMPNSLLSRKGGTTSKKDEYFGITNLVEHPAQLNPPGMALAWGVWLLKQPRPLCVALPVSSWSWQSPVSPWILQGTILMVSFPCQWTVTRR